MSAGPVVNVAVPSEGGELGIYVGDLNGDGRTDLVIATQPLRVMLQGPGRTFGNPTSCQAIARDGTLSGMSALNVGDVNKDGICRCGDKRVRCRRRLLRPKERDPSGTRDRARGMSPAGVGIGDISGDGRADIIVANRGFGSVTTIIQQAEGGLAAAWRPAEVEYPQWELTGISVGDLNGDGEPDLAVATDDLAVL
jgi:hypothetical protein